MDDAEIQLHGGTHGPVVRIGNTVRRLPGSGSKGVHALLRHLQSCGFSGAPKFLGIDDRGREILSYIPGEVAVRRDGEPLPDYVRSDKMLEHLGRLIRKFHDATVSFNAPSGVQWSLLDGAPRDGDVICHNDLGPWNTVFRKGEPVAFIDWDGAAPAPRMWELAYAAYRFVPFVPDEICSLLGWREPPNRLRRTHLLCDSYGTAAGDLLWTIERRIELMIGTGDQGNADGNPRFGAYWMNVMRLRLLRDLDFVRAFSQTYRSPASFGGGLG